MAQVTQPTRLQQVEKGGFLGVASLLVATGISLVEKNLVVGLVLTVLGVALYLVREFRK